MQFYGKAEETATKILDAFKAGTIAKAVAPVFIKRKDDVPCRAWSWGNQILTIINGTDDARGFRQWEEVKRHVVKGAKAFHILVPIMKKLTVAENGAERVVFIPVAFKTAPVFRIQDTDGEPLPAQDTDVKSWIDSLPLIDVARAWGINVDVYSGGNGRAQGKFIRSGDRQAIALGVKNLSTWAHELMHAADHRLGNLKEHGQHWRSETVAELGGAVLLETLGFSEAADLGGCWEYVSNYALASGLNPVAACMDVLKRTCDAIDSILVEAEKLNVKEPA